jgi:CHAT domain-containing protein
VVVALLWLAAYCSPARAAQWSAYVAVEHGGTAAGRACAAASAVTLFVADTRATTPVLRLPGDAWAELRVSGEGAYRVFFHQRDIGVAEHVAPTWRVRLAGGDADCSFEAFDAALSPVADPGADDVMIDASMALEAAIADALAASAAGQPQQARRRLAGIETAAPATPSTRMRAYLHRAHFAIDAGATNAAAADLAQAQAVRATHVLDAGIAATFERSLALRIDDAHGERARVVIERKSLDAAMSATAGVPDEDRVANHVYLALAQLGLGQVDDAAASLDAMPSRMTGELSVADPLRTDAIIARARIDRERGAYRAASERVRAALQDVARASGTANLAYAELAFAYAQNAAIANRPFDAIPALVRGVAWLDAELGRDNVITVKARGSLAFVYAFAERLPEAIAVQREVVASYRAMPFTAAERVAVSHILANLLGRDQRYAESYDLLVSLVAEARRARLPDDVVAHLDLDLAYVLWQTRGPRPACERVAAVHASVGSAAGLRASLRSDLELLAAMCTTQVSRDEGIAQLRDVVAARGRLYGKESLGVLRAQGALARAQIDGGDAAGARATLSEFAATAETLRREEAPDAVGARNAFSEWLVSDALFAGYRDLAMLHARAGDTVRAIAVSEAVRARSLGDAIGLNTDLRGLPTRAQYRAEALRTSIRAREAELALLAPSDPARYALQASLADATQELAALRRASSTNDAATPAFDLERLRARIPSGSAFVGIQIVHDGAWAYVVRRDRPPAVVMLDRAVPLVEALRPFRVTMANANARLAPIWRKPDGAYANALTAPATGAQRIAEDQLAQALGESFVAPLLPLLGGIRRLIAATEGPLAGVPLDALMIASARVGSRWDVQYAPSLTVWAAGMNVAKARGARSRELIAIGAPDYGAMAAGGAGPLPARTWMPLPGASAEVETIAAMFPRDRRMLAMGDDASKQHVTVLAQDGAFARTRYLHIAAHGVLAADAPQWSSIVLADRGAISYLTAAELATFDIRADLVTLSACETALGKDVAGEGVFGLPYALAVAGARATLLTFWPVADRPTAEFMRRFYAKLARGSTPARALAQTKREFMTSEEYSAPFYWAAFVLYSA